MILNMFVAATAFLFLSSLHYLWEETKKDVEDSINAGIRRDFHRTIAAIQNANFDSVDKIIQDFGDRWKPYVGYGQLRHYTQELIRESLNKELYTDGNARTGRALI